MEKKQRIEVVDALRGFAILGIMLLHSIEHFNFYVFPDAASQPAWLSNLDQMVWDSLFFLFGGKGYAIFSILFGFTFSLMYAKQKKEGADFGYRFLWRMLLLAGFAFVNGALFPGEVLLMYSILGVSLFFVRNLSSSKLLIVSVFFLLQPIDWTRLVYYLFNGEFILSLPRAGLWAPIIEAQKGESLMMLLKSNTLNGHKVSLMWAWDVGRLSQTIGLFMFGFWLGKKNMFDNTDKNKQFWLKSLLISFAAFIPLYFAVRFYPDFISDKTMQACVKPIVSMYRNFSFTVFLVSAFILLFKTNTFKRIAGGLKYPGRMSLTAYVMQSIIGGFVFYGYGLGLGPQVRHTVALGIGIVLFVIQYYFCKWWIIKYKQGPLEKLWHYLTWMKK